MDFVTFLIYDLILFFIKLIIGLVIYRLLIKTKCISAEKIALKSMDDYFKAYDKGIFEDPVEDKDFVDTINIIDTDNDKPKFF